MNTDQKSGTEKALEAAVVGSEMALGADAMRNLIKAFKGTGLWTEKMGPKVAERMARVTPALQSMRGYLKPLGAVAGIYGAFKLAQAGEKYVNAKLQEGRG